MLWGETESTEKHKHKELKHVYLLFSEDFLQPMIKFLLLNTHLTALDVYAFSVNGAELIPTPIFKHILVDVSRTTLLKDVLPILSD